MSLVTVSLGGDMLGELLERTTRGARLAALIAVALVAGFGVATALGAPGPTRLVTVVVGDQSASSNPTDEATESAKPEKTGKPAKTSKPEKSEESDEAGAHGACVAKVAQDASKVGGPHHNHGWAVSRAAHTCPHSTPTSTGG